MGTHDGDAYTGGGDGHVVGAPDLLGLLDHLHLLLVVADLWVHLAVVAEQVEGVLQGQEAQGIADKCASTTQGLLC